MRSHGFEAARYIRPGDGLVERSGKTDVVATAFVSTAPSTVYNFTVGQDHTYFVVAGGHAVWVHNGVCSEGGYWEAERTPSGVTRGRPLSSSEAIRRVRNGDDVYAGGRGSAKSLARKATGRRPIGPEQSDGPGYRPHFHTHDRNGSHIFY